MVVFYNISATVNYLMPNSVYTYKIYLGGAHGVMVIIDGNGHDNTSSNPGSGWLHFT